MHWFRAGACLAIVLVLGCAVTQGAERGAKATLPLGYTIPIVDLAKETHRQVVIDREEGQYLGHPTTVLLEDNKTMICVYPKGHGRGAIVMKRSTDAGLTWSERLPTPENWATSKEVPTIYRVVDAKGVKRLIMFSGLYPNRIAVSEDDGATWSPLEPIHDFGGIVSMACCVRLNDGRYMALFHDDGRFFKGKGERGPFILYKTLSEDGGLTWSDPIVVGSHPEAHLCEPGVVRSPDGKQLAMLLRENSRQYNGFVMFSNDEGETWTEPREVPASLTGDRHVGRYAPDGRLVITFRDTTHKSPTQGDFVAWVGTYKDIVAGREGQYRVRLMDNTKGADCAYPALDLLPDGTFIATTYGHWVKGEQPFIMSCRFKIEEIDAKAKAKEDQAAAPPLPGPGLLLSFDDAHIDAWLDALPIFAKYDAHATFFISGFEGLKEDQVAGLHRLAAAGHAIGFHGVKHRKAPAYVREHGAQRYLDDEIHPGLAAMREAGFNPTSFAYPMSASTEETDAMLLALFRHLRTGPGPDGTMALAELDALFTPFDGVAERGCLRGRGVDTAGDPGKEAVIDEVRRAMDRAKAKGEILTLYAHSISEKAPRNHLSPATLDTLLAHARDTGLRFYTFDDLP